MEAEGTIVSTSTTGELYGLKSGNRVVWQGTGAYAEYSVVLASKVYVLPSGLKPGAAAASFSQGVTALTFIQRAYHVKKGEWILVQGATGGVGHGAEFTLNYSHEDIVARVTEITDGVGVAAIFDSVGAATFDIGLQALARDGTMVSIGNTSGNIPPLQITALMQKNLRVMRPSVFGYLLTRDEFVGYAKELFDNVLKNKTDVMIYEVYPLAEVARAHTDLEGRKTAGKLLLKV